MFVTPDSCPAIPTMDPKLPLSFPPSNNTDFSPDASLADFRSTAQSSDQVKHERLWGVLIPCSVLQERIGFALPNLTYTIGRSPEENLVVFPGRRISKCRSYASIRGPIHNLLMATVMNRCLSQSDRLGWAKRLHVRSYTL